MSDLKFVFKVGDVKRFFDVNNVADDDVLSLEVDFKATQDGIKPTIIARIKGKDASLSGMPDPPGLPQ